MHLLKIPALLFLICDGDFLAGPTLVLPRASSPLTISPKSATPTTSQASPSADDDERVNVTITVEATGPQWYSIYRAMNASNGGWGT